MFVGRSSPFRLIQAGTDIAITATTFNRKGMISHMARFYGCFSATSTLTLPLSVHIHSASQSSHQDIRTP
jgi:hypothetical protein